MSAAMTWSKAGFDYHPCGCPGLTRHATGWQAWPFGAFNVPRYGWSLVHLPTGFEVMGTYFAPTLARLESDVAKILPLTDWNETDANKIAAVPNLFRQVREILEAQS